jgi:16S rRNA (cytosine967-C5)-methyltransferase
MRAPTARSVAATAIERVIADGAFAAAALDAELDRAIQLDARDRGLATELVYGTLRLFPWLEERVGRHAKRGTAKLDPIVRAHLALAAYQILVLTRIPPFAAVSEGVGAIRAVRGPEVAGFANAVLRKIAKEPRPEPDELARARRACLDPALYEALVRAIGAEGANALTSEGGEGAERAPPLGLRVEDASARATFIARWAEARPNAVFEPGALSPHAVLAFGAGKLTDLPGYSEGAWTPQEEGSQVVALSLGARPGDVVLDACAGRGQKTGLVARAPATVDAADVHPKKLERLTVELERIGLRPRSTFAVDWTRGTGEVTGPYDRILVDAPCSGTGTLRRRPELALRRATGDVPELAATQRAILARVAPLLRPGGRLVYAVCSVLREEAEDVLESPEVRESGLEPAPFDAPVALAVAGAAASFRLLPHVHGTDGYFVASLTKRK